MNKGYGVVLITLILALLCFALPVWGEENVEQTKVTETPKNVENTKSVPVDIFPQGPMRYSNDLMTQTFVMVPVTERAALPSKKGEWSCQLGFTNQFVKQNDGSTIIDIDLEEWRFTTFYRRRISNNFAWGFDIPFRYQSSGFLDEFIQKFHRTFGMPNSDRGDYQNNDFGMVILNSKNGVGWNNNEGAFGLSDIVLHGRYLLDETENNASSIRAAWKLPTATDDSFTSGRHDVALGVAYESKLFSDLYLFSEVNHTWTKSLNNHEFRTSNRFSGSATVEYKYNPRLTFFTQANFMQAGLITGNYDADRDSTSLIIGSHWKKRGIKYSAAITEDLTVDTSPDFGVLFAINF